MTTQSVSYTRRTVDREDYEAIDRFHFRTEKCPDPTAGDDPRMVSFQAYLYAPSRVCPASAMPVVSARILAGIEGKERAWESKNYVARDFLLEFRERVDPSFEWTRHDVSAGKPRRARGFKFYPHIRDRIRNRVGLAREDRRVYADDGAPAGRKSQAIELAAAREAVRRQDAPALCVEQGRLLDYLNTAPSNRFTAAYRSHHADAYALAARLFHTREISWGQYEAALVALATMGDQPTPVYSPSRSMRTHRVFPVTTGLATMRTEVSAVFRQEWATYDLQSAQAAINAHAWGAWNFVDFLAETVTDEGALWRRLFGDVGLDYDAVQAGGGEAFKTVKRALKAAVYSVQYGKKTAAVIRDLDRALRTQVDRAGARLFDDPLVQEIAERRDHAYEALREAGGAETCFGDWVALEPSRDEASVAAQVAQAQELGLLVPALDLAEATNRWRIVLWQHDGFDVAVADASRVRTYDREIRAAVDEGCARLGVPTRLVGELPDHKRSAVRRLPSSSRTTAADRPPRRSGRGSRTSGAAVRTTTQNISGRGAEQP